MSKAIASYEKIIQKAFAFNVCKNYTSNSIHLKEEKLGQVLEKNQSKHFLRDNTL